MERSELKGAIESLMYVSGEPISFVELQRVFEVGEDEIRSVVAEMADEMQAENRGIYPLCTDTTVKFGTNPRYEEWLIKLLAPPEERTLSDSIMETLSIIAYRQPVTRADIESVRGVRCEYAVSTLLKQGFIREVGRKDCIGRPMMFGTTDAFLVRFGLHSLEELPPLPASEDENNETEYRIGENV